MWCCPVQSRATHKARLPKKKAPRERAATAKVQKANEKVSAVIAHNAEEEAKEEVGQSIPWGRKKAKRWQRRWAARATGEKSNV